MTCEKGNPLDESRIGLQNKNSVDNKRMELIFTKTLNKALKGKNISQVAREIGMPRNMLHDWTKAKRVPSLANIKHIQKLADYREMTHEELLVGKSEKKTISCLSFSDEGREYKFLIERTK